MASMDEQLKQNIRSLFICIYENAEKADRAVACLAQRLACYDCPAVRYAALTEQDSMLITYCDTLTRHGENGLATMNRFLTDVVGDAFSTVHLLPMFPFSSDDGFSIIDYRSVNATFGSWSDIDTLKEHYGLMFDAVLNHMSVSSDYQIWNNGGIRTKNRCRRCYRIESRCGGGTLRQPRPKHRPARIPDYIFARSVEEKTYFAREKRCL